MSVAQTPSLPDDSARSQAYAAADELASIGASPLLDAISIFDCASLRQAGLPKTAAALRELIFAYDWIVILPSARAAKNDA